MRLYKDSASCYEAMLNMYMAAEVLGLLEGKVLLEDEKTGVQYDYYWDDDKDMYMPVIPNEKQA